MAVSHLRIPVSPERVFAVLSDPDSYGYWVVGSDTIRHAEDTWPAPGSRFHHRVGFGPFKISDHTEVLDCEPPRRLVLRARARPLLTARVTLHIHETNGVSDVTMVEEAADPLSRVLFNPLAQPLIRLRNDRALRRLSKLATS
jgi:uncharacterized protein YndB with AHSA1/START domain